MKKSRLNLKSDYPNKVSGLQSRTILNHKSQNSIFTLIEILMVCALLAFLMAIMVGGYGIAMTKMAEADCRATIAKIATALESYKAKTGYYIQAIQNDSTFLIDKPEPTQDFSDFLPGYEKLIKKAGEETSSGSQVYTLIDPYGTAYWYRCPGTHNRTSFDLESAGPDGEFGYSDESTNHLLVDDADENADNIKNWE